MSKVVVRRETKDAYPALQDLHPILQRIYHSRDVRCAEDVNRALSGLLPFKQLTNIDKAAERLARALEAQEHILIIGDFDADGATSTAVAMLALRSFGADNVDYLVPNRFTYGYGLTPEIVNVASAREPDLIVTVDNGISSVDGVQRAKELNIDVLVTDHHLPGDELPEAYAIVNPNLPGDVFPSKCIAGVGVIFYVMLALRHCLKQKNWFQLNNLECPNMANLLDLVALGTVADVVPFDKNNRVLVYQGLKRIRAGMCRQGLRALLELSKRDIPSLTASDLGFAIGPRLNAAGRLDDMSLGIACLLADSELVAADMAEQLDQLNMERRAIETQMKQDAFNIVESMDLDGSLPMGVALYDSNWHQGVVGLVASRVKDKVHRPTIAFALGEDGMLKGSARSVKDVNIRDVLENIATVHPDLIAKYGGHAMAAGLSIKADDFAKFQQAFAKGIEDALQGRKPQVSIETDGPLCKEHLTVDTVRLLRDAGPWGQEFPEPTFDGYFDVMQQRIVGDKHVKMVLKLPDEDCYVDAIFFNANLNEWPQPECSKIHLVYRLGINDYNGRRKLQLIILQADPADDVNV